eukprot:TRINITY_DN91_c0_g2_i9.p1 TRINITY_DN91_c0_g2~~TRINITY_DN91_c0_g2_i9.p1  ORF type:complete len:1998 (+),score=378.84 TRINITY_DN91_c0_g2_i9:471-5996(+)
MYLSAFHPGRISGVSTPNTTRGRYPAVSGSSQSGWNLFQSSQGRRATPSSSPSRAASPAFGTPQTASVRSSINGGSVVGKLPILSGPGVEKHEIYPNEANFHIHGWDGTGNLAVTITCATTLLSSITTYVQKVGPLEYHVRYTIDLSGEYTLTVTYEGHPLPPTPHRFRFIALPPPPPPEPVKFSFGGPGLVSPVRDVDTNFWISVNRGVHLPERLTVDVTTEDGNQVRLTEESDRENEDKHFFKFFPTRHGNHRLEVLYGDEPIPNIPSVVRVVGVPSGPKSFAHVKSPVKENRTSFILQSVSEAGIHMNEGGHRFDVTVVSPDGSIEESFAQDLGNGQYQVKYLASQLGIHKIGVSYGGAQVRESPFRIEVLGIASALHSIAHGEGLISPLWEGEGRFVVEAYNERNIRLTTGGDNFHLTVIGPDGQKLNRSALIDNNDGTYSASYFPLTFGLHTVHVQLDEVLLRNFPIQVNYKKKIQDPYGPNCVAEGPGVDTINPVLQDNCRFLIRAVDDSHNPILVGGHLFGVEVLALPENRKVECSLVDKNDGTYQAHYFPRSFGKFEVNVHLEGKSIKASPFVVNVIGEPYAFSSYVQGPGVISPVYEDNTGFEIQACNRDKLPLTTGGHKFEVVVVGPDRMTVPCTVTDLRNGKYDVHYSPVRFGEHEIHVTYNNTHLSLQDSFERSPFRVRFVGVAVPSMCTAEGPGVSRQTTESNTGFEIKAFNKERKPLLGGGQTFVVEVFSTGGNEPKLVDKHNARDKQDGTYTTSWVSDELGEHKVHITLDGQHIKDSPFTVNLKGIASPFKSYALGDGLISGVMEDKTNFTIFAVTDKGKQLLTGGTPFEVRIVGPDRATVESSLHDNQDGTYSVQYFPTCFGDHHIGVTLDGRPIKDSPFKKVLVRGIPSARHSKAEGPGLESPVYDDVSTHFIIELMNAKGYPILSGGYAKDFAIAIKDDRKLNLLKAEESESGRYVVRYQPERIGNHEIGVLFENQSVGNSPWKVNVVGVPSDKSVVYGSGIAPVAVEGQTTFVIEPRNKKGQHINARGQFAVLVMGPNGKKVNSPIDFDPSAGLYAVRYFPDEFGTHLVHATIDGKHLPSKDLTTGEASNIFSPFEVNVQGIPSLLSEAQGPGIQTSCIEDDCHFVITTKNKDGKKINTGGHKFSFHVKGPDQQELSTKQIKDNNDGTYSCEYVPQQLGYHSVHVLLNNDELRQSPYRVEVLGVASPKDCIAVGDGLKKIVREDRTNFDIIAINSKGKHLQKGGDNFQVRVIGPDKQVVPSTINDLANGTYKVQYNPSQLGIHQVEVKLGNFHVQGSPFKDIEVQGIPSAQFSKIIGLEKSLKDKDTQFVIKSANKNGCFLTNGGYSREFFVKLSYNDTNEKVVKLQAIDENNGEYRVRFSVERFGDHKIEVFLRMLDGPSAGHVEHIQGSPKIFRVEGVPHPSSCQVRGPGVAAETTEDKTDFTIESFNFEGKPINQLLQTPYQVIVSGPDKQVLARRGNSQAISFKGGKYHVRYEPEKLGDHTVQVTLEGASVDKSPYTVSIKGVPFASQCQVSGPGVTSPLIDYTPLVRVKSFNKRGQEIRTGGHNYQLQVVGPDRKPVRSDVFEDLGDGTYVGKYYPEIFGEHKVSVILDSATCGQSPYTVIFRGVPSPPHCEARGPGLLTYVDEPHTDFSVELYDVNKQRTSGGHDVNVTVLGPDKRPIPSQCRDQGEGLYSAGYSPKQAGEHEVQISLNGVPIKDSPFRVQVRAMLDPSVSFVRSLQHTIKISCKDKRKQTMDAAGKIVVSIADPKGNLVESKTIYSSEDITVTFPVQERGVYKVSAVDKASGKQLEGCPVLVTIS